MTKHLNSPIIFLGFGRSGTTIISEIIFQHPDLAWISNYQAKFPTSRYINLLRNVFDNPLWKLSGQKEQLNKVPWYNKYIFLPGEPYQIWNELTGKKFGREFLYGVREDEKSNEIRSFFNTLVRLQNRKRLSFKITGPARLEYLHSLFPDAKYIWIKRDPLPNIRSLLNVDFYQSRKHALWWIGDGVYNDQEMEFAKKWQDTPALIAALQYYKIHEIFDIEKKKLGLNSDVQIIRYGDFVSNPEEQITTLLQFLELNKNGPVFEYLKKINIYNRNKEKSYYISKELDYKVKSVALNGIYGL